MQSGHLLQQAQKDWGEVEYESEDVVINKYTQPVTSLVSLLLKLLSQSQGSMTTTAQQMQNQPLQEITCLYA